ncbi:MAG: hypothetical protein KBD53_06355 [Candidatus Omnitrophica bacterium]|nr:hypothetical protein [Candidatus Omnitrophota bacterium]
MFNRKFIVIILMLGMVLAAPFSFAQTVSQESAEQLWQEKSYRLAAEQFKTLIDQNELSKEEIREINFKWADASWRTQETERYEPAVKTLNEIISSDPHDRWWAEANESLAEHYQTVNQWQHTEEIKQYLQNARQFWASSKDINLARPRFIKVTFRLGEFITQNWGWGYQGITPLSRDGKNILPNPNTGGLSVLYEEILKVTKSDEDRAKVYYSLAMSYYSNSYDEKSKKLAVEYFTKVIKEFSQSEWVDDSYYYLAQFYQQQNRLDEALKVYRDFLSRFQSGDSPWVDNIKSQVESIIAPQLQIGTSYTFLPGSETQFNVSWKNIKDAQLAIYPLNLIDQVKFDPSKNANDYAYGINNYQEFLQKIVTTNEYRRWSPILTTPLNLKNDGKYQWYNETKGLAEWLLKSDKDELNPSAGILKPGAYLLLVTANGLSAYDLILVTDLGIVTKMGGHSGLIYAFDSRTGEPKAQAKVKYQYRYYDDYGNWTWEQGEGLTNADGLLNVSFKNTPTRKFNNQHDLFAVVSHDQMQAFSQGNNSSYYENLTWWMYAYSDRPAYRPNEKVSFKVMVRGYNESAFYTPSGKRIQTRIYDARGNKIQEKNYTLNDFGTFSDELTLDEKATLGEYRMEIYSEDGGSLVGNTSLFRLEEYKLPEFLVNVKPKPNADGQVNYQLGDEIEVELDAQYYFGGGVANADVEFLIYQNPYYHYYYPAKRYPWYYDDTNAYRWNNYYGGGTLIKKETIKTDKDGKAAFRFETPDGGDQDFEYRIEVRVVDQSRREITASSSIKVTKSPFYAYLTAKNNLYRPGDKAEVEIKTLTANNDPVSVDGKISVSRNWWHDQVLREGQVVNPGGYDQNVLFTKFVKTNEKGEAVFAFEPDQDGYYSIQFTAFDKKGKEIQSQTNVFVCDKQSKDLGYRYGGVQIIAEKDTYSIGEMAKVMIVTDKPGAWVLFSEEVDEIFGHQLLFMEGTVKLLEFKVDKTFTPNIFLNAVSVDNYQLRTHNLQLIVPPNEKFLNIKIVSDKETYRPREEGIFDIEVTDYFGKPVLGEVSLGLVDASVYYIQDEYVQDIRQFFYGAKRQQTVQTNSSFNYKQYQKLVRAENMGLVTQDALLINELRDKNARLDDSEKDSPVGQKQDYRMNAAKGAVQSASLDAVSEMSAAGGVASPAVRGMERREFKELGKLKKSELADEKGSGDSAGLKTPTVRQDFRSTAFWQPSIKTDANGKATLKIKFPDSLTTWRATARTISRNTDVGDVTHETKTNKDVMIRLQAPRFFTERDTVILSANVHNYTDKVQKIKVSIDAKGLRINDDKELWLEVAAHDEQRVNWKAISEKQGQADITVSAQATDDADAMIKSYPIIPHGIEKFIAKAVVNRNQQVGESVSNFVLDIPKERIEESTSLNIILSPSLAATMLDALPYLADFPYGCVEQTMSRFLPAVIVKKTLKDLGLSEKDINDYINQVLIPREDPDHPQRRTDITVNKLDEMTQAGLDRLYDFQHGDGGWGWWKEGDSDRFMTAYVVWGMSTAQAAGIDIRVDALNNAVNYLQRSLVEEENQPDMLAWMLHALASAHSKSEFETKQIERLWEMRDKLNPYTRALFSLSQHYRGDNEKAQVLARNLANGMIEDKENGTIHWGESGIYYRFSEGGVEATAFVIKALSNISPESEFIQPAVKWMALNRRGARWKNTRDTSIAILGLADYLRTTNELSPEFNYTVMVNGKNVREGKVDRNNLFTFNRQIDLPNESLKDGENTVEVRVNGAGSLYTSGYLKYFTLEENITPAGNEVFVERRYFIEDTAETLLQGYETDWRPLEDGAIVKSGDRIKVEITLNSKNNYEYLIVEDYKPAGLEAVELTSGSAYAQKLDKKGKPSGESTWIYQELRDQKAAFFVDQLKEGKHLISYELRAEVPGTFHAMPNQTHAMYVPEIRANSSEMVITVTDKE